MKLYVVISARGAVGWRTFDGFPMRGRTFEAIATTNRREAERIARDREMHMGMGPQEIRGVEL